MFVSSVNSRVNSPFSGLRSSVKNNMRVAKNIPHSPAAGDEIALKRITLATGLTMTMLAFSCLFMGAKKGLLGLRLQRQLAGTHCMLA